MKLSLAQTCQLELCPWCNVCVLLHEEDFQAVISELHSVLLASKVDRIGEVNDLDVALARHVDLKDELGVDDIHFFAVGAAYRQRYGQTLIGLGPVEGLLGFLECSLSHFCVR